MPNDLYQQDSFIGLDVDSAPQNVDANHCQTLDNLLIVGGEAITRPAIVGQWTAALGNPVYPGIAYIKPDGSTNLLLVSGGTLYYYVKGASAPVAISLGVTLVSANVQMARVGRNAFLVDGSNALYKVSIDNTNAATTAAVTGLSQPTTTPVVSLTNTTIDALTSTSGWAGDTFASYTSGASLIAGNQSDINGYSGPYILDGHTVPTGQAVGTRWVAIGTTPSILQANGAVGIPSAYANIGGANATTQWFGLDDPGGGYSTLTGASALQNPVLASPNGDRYCTQFLATYNYYTSDNRSLQGIILRIKAYSDVAAATLIAVAEDAFTPLYNPQQPGQIYQHVFTFPNLPAEIKSVVLEIVGNSSNVNAAQFSNFMGFPYAANITLCPLDNGITLSASTDGLSVSHAESSSANRGAFGGARITKTFGADQDWSTLPTIAIGLKTAAGASYTVPQLIQAGLQFKVGFRANGGTIHYFTPYAGLDTTLSYAVLDLSTVPPSILSAFRYLEVAFTSDLDVSASTVSFLVLGPITTAGNLSLTSQANGLFAAPYTYVRTEITTGVDGTVESEASPISNYIAPTGLQAEAAFTVPTKVNAAANGYRIYRLGGNLTDYYMVAEVSTTADQSMDATHTYSWNHTTQAFIDNTPDTALLTAGNVLITGRGNPPVGAQAIAEWQGRIWLAKGSEIYSSWLITAANGAAFYFNATVDPTNPADEVKGIQFSAGGADGDAVQRLIPMGAFLLVYKQRGYAVIGGTNALNFTYSELNKGGGVGLLAPKAATLVNGVSWFLGPDGAHIFDGDNEPPLTTQKIRKLLNPAQSGGAPISAAAYAKAAMVYSGLRLFLLAPRAGDSVNSVAYVFDTQAGPNGGWTRFVWKSDYSLGMTGGLTTATAADTADLYLCGSDGMLYKWTPNVYADKYSAGGGAVPVPFAFKSRAFGQSGQGAAYWDQNRPVRYFAQVTTGESTALTHSVSSIGNAAQWAKQFTQNGLARIRLKISGDVRGGATSAAISGAASTQTRITSVRVDVAEGKPKS